MKNFLIFLALTIQPGTPPSQDSLRILFWNVENFFDYFNDSTSVSDTEFSSFGARHWTKKRFNRKCNAIAKVLLMMPQHSGHLPDIVCFAEVENRLVLKRLLDETLLRKTDYSLLHFDSPDHRGIDVALLYRTSRVKLASSKSCHILDSCGSVIPTRDILVAGFVDSNEDSLALEVCHFPSKYSGAASNYSRSAASSRLVELSDSLLAAGWRKRVAIGDFNDVPESDVFSSLQGKMDNLAFPVAAKGDGSIKFDGVWELIDQCLIAGIPHGDACMEVWHITQLSEKDSVHGGMKPLRTYSGPRYLGGVSDHCPIIVTLLL